MALKDILAISGKPGLYKFISQGRNGIIVESLTDNKRIHAPATAKISALEDIAIFTDEEEVSLQDVFKKINEKEEGGKTIDHKSSPEELKSYMVDVLPNYDRDRVYVSDLKKLYQWYNILHDLDMLTFEEEEEEEETNDDADASSGEDSMKKTTEEESTDQKPRNETSDNNGNESNQEPKD
jgi:hypothetical protein